MAPENPAIARFGAASWVRKTVAKTAEGWCCQRHSVTSRPSGWPGQHGNAAVVKFGWSLSTGIDTARLAGKPLNCANPAHQASDTIKGQVRVQLGHATARHPRQLSVTR